MRKILLSVLLFSTLSCGIPEYLDINTPVKNEIDSRDGSICAVSIKSSSITSKFSLYGRYYVGQHNRKYFEDLELDDVPQGSEKYLTDRGYQILDIEKDSELYNTYLMSIDTAIKISYDPPDPSGSIIKYLEINGTRYPVKYRYDISGKEERHYIGNYSDSEGTAFKSEYVTNNPDISSIDTIQIEFAVIAKGLNPTTVTNIESVPVHIGYLDLQTRE